MRDVVGRLAEVLGRERSWVQERTRWGEHHPGHLASAFFVSPWDEAAVCAIDGFGDFVSTSLRRLDEPVAAHHEAVAASLQVVFEEAACHVLNALHARTRLDRLCLAGGCGMNSVMNGKIRALTPFKDVFIQPASADNGTALGAAFYTWHQLLGRPRRFVMEHGYWGPEFGDAAVEAALRARASELAAIGCRVQRIGDEEELCRWAAERIAAGQIVGWFQGRMEWGGPARSGTAASWPIHAARTCGTSSTPGSSSESDSGPLLRPCSRSP